MKRRGDTTKRVPALQARTRFGEILKSVQSGQARYLVEKGGIPVAGIISAEEFQRLIEEREARFRLIDEIRSGLPSVPEEEVASDVASARAKVRAKRRGSGRS
ncbi:MAG: type II toxin-antitoxin system prevent-host-death family antitoxin [Nitrospirae bacterium]|nr:type II toxin-antitoxin system prevent-host-death family antitoxin [Nitrospirota bacterium]